MLHRSRRACQGRPWNPVFGSSRAVMLGCATSTVGAVLLPAMRSPYCASRNRSRPTPDARKLLPLSLMMTPTSPPPCRQHNGGISRSALLRRWRPKRGRPLQREYGHPKVAEKLLATCSREVAPNDPGGLGSCPKVAQQLSNYCSGSRVWPKFTNQPDCCVPHFGRVGQLEFG